MTITLGSTGKPRAITRDRLEAAGRLKQREQKLRPTRVRAERISEVDPAYVAAIINAIDDEESLNGRARHPPDEEYPDTTPRWEQTPASGQIERCGRGALQVRRP